MSASICNNCIRRNCRMKPFSTKREGRWGCYKFMPIKGGWSMLELLVASSPIELVTLCHRFGLEVKETKKGYNIYAKGRNTKFNKRTKNKRKKVHSYEKKVSVDNENRRTKA